METEKTQELPERTCWDRSLFSFGTGYIFGREAKRLRIASRWITFLGIAVPVFVGSATLSFTLDSGAFRTLIAVASALSIVQLTLSTWALVAGWEHRLAYAQESSADNYRLSDRYERLV